MLKPPEPQRIAIQVFLYTGPAANQRATNPAAGTDEAESAEDGADCVAYNGFTENRKKNSR